MRPWPLIASTSWRSALAVGAFAYATYVDVTSGLWLVGAPVLAILFFLTCSVLWFLWSYWQGQDWTRTFVIIALILKAVSWLIAVAYLYRGFFFPVRAADLIFSIYIFYWLMTKEARSYSTFKARTN
jgi:hypothetical protein